MLRFVVAGSLVQRGFSIVSRPWPRCPIPPPPTSCLSGEGISEAVYAFVSSRCPRLAYAGAVLVGALVGEDLLDALIVTFAENGLYLGAVSSSYPGHGSLPRRVVIRLRIVVRFWFLRS